MDKMRTTQRSSGQRCSQLVLSRIKSVRHKEVLLIKRIRTNHAQVGANLRTAPRNNIASRQTRDGPSAHNPLSQLFQAIPSLGDTRRNSRENSHCIRRGRQRRK